MEDDYLVVEGELLPVELDVWLERCALFEEFLNDSADQFDVIS